MAVAAVALTGGSSHGATLATSDIAGAAQGTPEPIFAYAGLRTAGRDGVNYLIDWARQGVLNVAAIRSTGLSASLGIGEYVAQVIAPGREVAPIVPWWRRAADHRA